MTTRSDHMEHRRETPASITEHCERAREIRAAREYTVSIQYSSGEIMLPATLGTLDAAKRTAREAWDTRPGMRVIIRSGSRSWEASQTHGSGMLWH